MFKRNLVLGGLLAGAFLVPSLAVAAGSVNGPCVNCHTMHNSQGGAARFGAAGTPASDSLLAFSGCVGCHANGSANLNTGKAADVNGGAPQVTGNGFVLNGGYFTLDAPGTLAISKRQHNVNGITTKDPAIFPVIGYNGPGGGARAALLECKDCHSLASHHKDSGGKYRMLAGNNASKGTATQQPGKDYGALAAGAGVAVGTRSEVIYQATDMNAFCAGCHGSFHQGAAPASAGGNQRAADLAGVWAGTWVRHPTDIQVATSGSNPSILTLTPAAIAAGSGANMVVVGSTLANPDKTTAASASTVMCISCHVPHGGPYDDLLAFNYDQNKAGDASANPGCETCHSYASGM